MSTTFKGPVPVPAPQSSPVTLLITGASRGLGLELVRQYTEAHSDNIIFAGVRNVDKATDLKAYASIHPNVHIIPLDVDSEDSVRASVKLVESKVNHIDVIINNAAQFSVTPLDKLHRDELTALFQTNVAGSLSVILAYLPLAKRSSNAKVINVSSVIGSNPAANIFGSPFITYGLSKAALTYLTSALRYAEPTITFIAVHPGWVATDMGNFAGKAAPTGIADSVQALRYYINKADIKQSGNFLDAMTGDIIPF